MRNLIPRFLQFMPARFIILLLFRGGRVRPAKPKTMRASSKHEEMNLELAIKTLGVPKKEAGKYVANL